VACLLSITETVFKKLTYFGLRSSFISLFYYILLFAACDPQGRYAQKKTVVRIIANTELGSFTIRVIIMLFSNSHIVKHVPINLSTSHTWRCTVCFGLEVKPEHDGTCKNYFKKERCVYIRIKYKILFRYPKCWPG
jgi:hypothetical protein